MEDVEKSTAVSTETAAKTAADNTDTSKSRKTWHKGLDALKFWLMPFVFFASFGFWSIPYSHYIRGLSLFAPIAFYILCGFAAAHGEKQWEAKPLEKRKGKSFYGRLIKRNAITFSVLFLLVVSLNLIYLSARGIPLNWIAEIILTKRTLFDFLVLCKWPFGKFSMFYAFGSIGETIWFLQALLYGRIILWGMDRLKIMRYYKVVLVLTVLLMILFGELAGVIRFNFHGYTVIPGNGITRALPYMLIGRYLYEKKDRLKKVPSWLFGVGFLLGIAAALGEWTMLENLASSMHFAVYTNHLVGYGIMALSACGFFLKKENMKSNFAALHGSSYARRMYGMSQPVGHLLLFIAAFIPPIAGATYALAGLITYLVCLFIAFIVGFIKFGKPKTKSQKERFSLKLWVKQTSKNRSRKRRAKKNEWREPRSHHHHSHKHRSKKNEWRAPNGAKFSLWLYIKQSFKRMSRRRRARKNEWRAPNGAKFSLWLYIKQFFRRLSRRHRSRKNQWREPRSHHHHSHHHHSHHHSHEYDSENHTTDQSE